MPRRRLPRRAESHPRPARAAATAHRRVSKKFNCEIRAGEIIVVGDTPHDIRCGRAIGAKVLAVATGGAEFDELKKHSPDWCVKDLSEVSAAEVCV